MKNHDLCAGKATLDFNLLLNVARSARASAAQRLRDALDEVAPNGFGGKGTPEEIYQRGIRGCIVADSMKWDVAALIEANETCHVLEAMYNRPEVVIKNHPCAEYSEK